MKHFLPVMAPSTIKRLRKSLRLTQKQFGKRIGYAAITISCWECETLKPGPKAIAKIKQRCV